MRALNSVVAGGTSAVRSTRRSLQLIRHGSSVQNQIEVFPSTPKAPRIAIAIMAAGKGTRLKSKHPKVLHEVGGKPILAHVIATAQKIVPAQDIFVIVGHEAERVREAVGGTGVNFVLQAEQRGTGHALMVAREALSDNDNKAGNNMTRSSCCPATRR